MAPAESTRGTTTMSTVMTRNNQAGPTIFRDKKNDVLVEYQGKGDPSGNDVQPVPESVLTHPQFSKAVTRGIITVLDEDANAQVTEAMARQSEAFQAVQAHGEQAVSESLNREAERDLLGIPCVGPSAKGQAKCGDLVPVPVQQRDDIVPLCPQHSHLSTEFFLVHTEELDDDGKPITQWQRATLGPREG